MTAPVTEVQLLSFVYSAGVKGSKPGWWNMRDFGGLPLYALRCDVHLFRSVISELVKEQQ